MKRKIIIILAAVFITAGSGSVFAQKKVDWNGYLQLRYSNNYLNQAEFSVRRAKVWVKGEAPEADGGWSYKMQAEFQKSAKYQLALQDAYISYQTGVLNIKAGQFVTDFSLQRKQSDYKIPLVERARAVTYLVPGAETMGRDIGLQVNTAKSKSYSFSLGLFNGNGANVVSNNKNFLYVNKGSLFLLSEKQSSLELGYSLSYRNAHSFQFTKITGSNFIFTGNDFRFGFDGRLAVGNFSLQSDYIEAHLGDQKADGYYVLTDYLLNAKNLLALSVEQYNDLNPATNDDPWYVLGYSYMPNGNKLKFSLDNRVQFTSNKTNSLTTVQVQYFFN